MECLTRLMIAVILVCTSATLTAASPIRPQRSAEIRKDVDTPGLVIEAEAGWDGIVDRTKPVSVSFLLSNFSDQLIEGRLRLTDPMMGEYADLGEIVLGPQSTRRFSAIRAMSEWYECYASIDVGGKVIWRRELQVQTGSEFDDSNFVMFVDDSGRRPPLPGAITRGSTATSRPDLVAPLAGRPVRCLTAKSWQLPDHPGPLVGIQAIIFHEETKPSDLNRTQWRAVADWICQGGAAFVHSGSTKISDGLIAASPLTHEAPVDLDGFNASRMGLGAIYEYEEPLFSSSATDTRQQLVTTVAGLPRNHISTDADAVRVYRSDETRANMNRFYVIGFFGIYTLFCGVVSIFLFRMSRRRILIYTVTVVVGASILSGLLGGMLRLSRGDLKWGSVTKVGAGGLTQVGFIDVQSAGSRNNRVRVAGEHADLQFARHGQSPYRWGRSNDGIGPFTWRPSLSAEDDTYEVNVPITPWGERRLYTSAFRRDAQRMKFTLSFEPSPSHAGSIPTTPDGVPQVTPMPRGQFSLEVQNNLPFDIADYWLVVGASVRAGADVSASSRMQFDRFGRYLGQQIRTPTDGMIDIYHTQYLSTLPRGQNYSTKFEATFDRATNMDFSLTTVGGRVPLPRLQQMGKVAAWLVCRVPQSPVIEIDAERTEFVPRDELHLVIQEIRPEDMSAAALLISEQPAGDAAQN